MHISFGYLKLDAVCYYCSHYASAVVGPGVECHVRDPRQFGHRFLALFLAVAKRILSRGTEVLGGQPETAEANKYKSIDVHDWRAPYGPGVLGRTFDGKREKHCCASVRLGLSFPTIHASSVHFATVIPVKSSFDCRQRGRVLELNNSSPLVPRRLDRSLHSFSLTRQ